MPNIGFPELILILVIALIIFGPSKLPSIGGAVGKALKEFKKASSELLGDSTPAPTPTVVAVPVAAPVVASVQKVDEPATAKSDNT